MKKTIIVILSTTLLLTFGPANAATKPLSSKENKSSCTYIKAQYKSSAMLDWSKGLTTDQDLIKEIDLNIKMLSSRGSYTNGKIKTQVALWLSAEKNTKISLIDNDVEGISNAMTLKISSVNKLNKLCKSIGK
jgi:hypothetical protein